MAFLQLGRQTKVPRNVWEMEVREGPLSAVVIGEVERRRLADTGGLRLPSFLCTKMLHDCPRVTRPTCWGLPFPGGGLIHCPPAGREALEELSPDRCLYKKYNRNNTIKY